MKTTNEMVDNFIKIGKAKVGYQYRKTLVLSILAGAFIAFAAGGSAYAVHAMTGDSKYLGKVVAGALFGTGLIMVVLGGCDLFTGSTLIAFSVFDKQVKVEKFAKNLGIVFVGNLIGSLIVVFLSVGSGNIKTMGGYAVMVASDKANLSFLQAFCSGVLCCILVAMAVFMASGSSSAVGKIFAIFFPIWLFISSGYEHSIANMFYIPAGLFAKLDSNAVQKALSLGAKQSAIDNLNWGTFFLKNLLPVALGNIVGGSLFVAFPYFLVRGKKKDLVIS